MKLTGFKLFIENNDDIIFALDQEGKSLYIRDEKEYPKGMLFQSQMKTFKHEKEFYPVVFFYFRPLACGWQKMIEIFQKHFNKIIDKSKEFIKNKLTPVVNALPNLFKVEFAIITEAYENEKINIEYDIDSMSQPILNIFNLVINSISLDYSPLYENFIGNYNKQQIYLNTNKLNNKVDYRPEETTPEDYYAL